MSQWFKENGYLIIVFIAVCVAAVFIFRKAVMSYSSYRRSYNSQTNELKRLTALKEKYRNITAEELSHCDEEEILEGTALIYQLQLQKQENMEKAFETLSAEKQYIYTLDVFVNEDSVKSFFAEYGSVLTEKLLPALCAIGMEDCAAALAPAKKMYDPLDEMASLDEKKLEELQKYISEKDILRKIKLSSAKYIKDNFDILKN